MSAAGSSTSRWGTFLGSAERVPFWSGPGGNPTLRILPDRPSLDGDGADSSTYAWFIWGAELSGPRVDVLDPTPATVRAAQEAAPPDWDPSARARPVTEKKR